MISAPDHPEENSRLKQLVRYEILDTEDEKAFDELTQLASEICGTSISLISLVDTDRQWFKSKVGLEASQTERSIAFCSHAILQDEVFEIENAAQDDRFHDNPLVTGAPDIRFYAGAPLITPDGYPIGTLCVIDQSEKKLSDFQKRALKTLSNQVVSQLEMRLQTRKLERLNKDRERLYAVLAHDLKSPFNGILNLSRIMSESSETMSPDQISHFSTEILNSSVTLYQVMDEILQWSQTRLNQGVISLNSVNVLAAIQETIALASDSTRIKEIHIDVGVDAEVNVLADSALFKTVIRNLLMNAIKFTPPKSVITMQASYANDKVLISVADQGEGVSEDIKNKLFVGAVESKQGSFGELGHGLGLSLASEFLMKQNGSISIDEGYSDGARFVVELAKA